MQACEPQPKHQVEPCLIIILVIILSLRVNTAEIAEVLTALTTCLSLFGHRMHGGNTR